MITPFDCTGVVRDAQGILRYPDLPASLVALLRQSVERSPHAEAVVEIGGGRLNYQQFWDAAARIAGGLRAQGIAPGDRVAIQLGNCLEWCLAFFGIQLAGGVVVPVNTRFSPPEVAYVISDSGAKFSFLPGEPLPDGPPFAPETLQRDDLAAIFYTSGTTGFPKGAMTTHENFLSIFESRFRIVPLPRDGSVRTLISIPLFHVTACNAQFLPTLGSGGTTVILPAFEIQRFLHALGDERINQITTVPAIYWLALSQPNLSEFDLANIRWLSYGGAPMAPELVGKVLEAFPNARVGNGFGLTETASVSTFLPHEYARTHPASVGFPIPISEVDLFEVSPDTGIGELLIRGANVVSGYWNKPEATAESFVNGWLHTGDMARISPEGFVQIVDRKKDMINRGGENVYCVEVENALAAHPAVLEVAVVGVPDAMMGEKVGAVLSLQPGKTATPAEIAEFARSLLADFKVPQYLVISATPLPRNPSGKILKPRLRNETNWGKPLR